MTATERETVQALLAWYAAMGADEAIGDMPVDCFAAPAAAVSTPPRVQPRPRPAAAQVAAAGALQDRSQPGQHARGARGDGGRLRGLRAQAHGEEPVLQARQRRGAHHADRRGAGPGRRPQRQALRRTRRAIARPHAGGDWACRGACLHHQHRLLAPARQPHADARGGRGLRAIPCAADRAARRRRSSSCSAAPRPRPFSAWPRGSCG